LDKSLFFKNTLKVIVENFKSIFENECLKTYQNQCFQKNHFSKNPPIHQKSIKLTKIEQLPPINLDPPNEHIPFQIFGTLTKRITDIFAIN
jgi:hypothetical protein